MIRVSSAHMRVAARTDAGRSGKNNEDNFAVSAYRLSDSDPTPSVLAVVADGIGGHRAGEVASALAVEHISQVVAESDGRDPIGTLTQAVVLSNHHIVSQAHQDNARLGMGSTCVCAGIIVDRLYTVSVGDSRLYWIRRGQIRQLTTDHTWVHDAVVHGIIRPEEARTHPNAHVIRRYLGSDPPPEADFRLRLADSESDEQALHNQGLQLLPGDVLLLCTDGLTDLVDDDEILSAVQHYREPEAIVEFLVALANERGGHDNITVVVLQMTGEMPTIPLPRMQLMWQAQQLQLENKPRWLWLLLGVLAALGMIALGLLLLWTLNTIFPPPVLTPTPPLPPPPPTPLP